MSAYARTADGFDAAYAAVTDSAKRHNRDYILYIPKKNPTIYQISMACMVDINDIAHGTSGAIHHPDGTTSTLGK